MKALRNAIVFLATNTGIGLLAIVVAIGIFVGCQYLLNSAEKLFLQITPPSVIFLMNMSILIFVAVCLLAVFGRWVRERVEVTLWKIRSQRQIVK